MRPTRTTIALSIFLLGAFTVLADIPPCGWSESFSATYMPGGIDFVNFIFATEDASGNVISVGGFKGTVSFGGQTNLTSFTNSANDIFIVKFDPSGKLLWGQAVGSTNADQAYGVATDSSGNIFVAGLYHGPVNFGVSNATAAVGTFLAKYNPGGICQWVNTIIGKPLSTIGHPVAVDSSGNPIVVAFDTVFKYASTTGAQLWATNVGGFGQAIAIDGNGDAFVAGYFSGTTTIGTNSFISAGADDCFVAKVYGANGYSGWSKAGGGSGEDTFRGIAVDQNSNVVAVGQFTGTATYSGSNIVSQYSAGIVASKYNGANGNLMFLRGLGPFSYTGSSAANAVCVDKNNNVLVTGIVTGGVDFGGGNVLGDGSGNVFIANFDDTTCNTVYAYQYGAIGPDIGFSISAGTGNIVVAGTFASGIDFLCGAMSDPFYFTQNGEYYGFLVKFSVKTFFVDPVSGNDSNPGTDMLSPWKHPPGSVGFTGTGWTQLKDGNSLIIKGGSTNNVRVEFNPSWYSGNANYDSIVVQSGHLLSTPWGTGQAIIDGQNIRTAGIAISGSNNIPNLGLTIDGFEIRNITNGVAGSGYDDQKGSSCILAGDSNYGARNLTIKRCWLHDALRGPTTNNATGEDTGHGIEFNGYVHQFIVTENTIGPRIGTKGCETYRASQGSVSNNLFTQTGDHCIALSNSTNVDACNNLIYYTPPQVHEPAYGIQIAGCSFCDVWNNVVYRPVPIVHSNFVVGPDTYRYDSSMGIGCYGGNLTNRIVNNTVAFFGDYNTGGNGSTAIRVFDDNGAKDSGMIFQNNLVFNCWNHDVSVSGGTEAYLVKTNVVSGESVKFNDFFSPTNSLQMSYANLLNPGFPSTVANYGLNTATDRAYTNNQQLDPVFTGGGLPTGLDSTYRPNSNYFLPFQGSVPFAVASTKNTINGDSVHGYSSSPTKFATDIAGTPRSLWSMGAYEVVYPSPVVAGNWTNTSVNSQSVSTAPIITMPFGGANPYSSEVFILAGFSYSTNGSAYIGVSLNGFNLVGFGQLLSRTHFYSSNGYFDIWAVFMSANDGLALPGPVNSLGLYTTNGSVISLSGLSVIGVTNVAFQSTPFTAVAANNVVLFPLTLSSDSLSPPFNPGDLLIDALVSSAFPFTNGLNQTFVNRTTLGSTNLQTSFSSGVPMTWTGNADTISHAAIAIKQHTSTAYVTNLRMQQ